MSNLSRMHTFWVGHIHSFYILVRFLFAVATALTASIATIYLLGKGLSYTEVGAVWSVVILVATVLDFPTGNFADVYGRKTAYVLGIACYGTGMLIYGAGTTLWMFFVAASFVGFGSAQISGSIFSWVIDELIKVNKNDMIAKIFGDGSAAASVGGIVGGVLIGLFFTGPLELLYYASGILFVFIALFVLVSIPDNYGQPTGRWFSLPKDVVQHYVHSRSLLILSGAFTLMLSCYTVFRFIWQPMALESGIQKGDLGYLYAVFMAGSAVGAFIAGRISKKFGEAVILLFCFLMACGGFLTIFLMNGMTGLLAGLLQLAVGYGGFLPLIHAYMNRFIPSSIRASTNSLISTLTSSGIIVLQVLMGIFIEKKGLASASLCGGVFALLGICTLLVMKRHEKLSEKEKN